MWVISIFLLLVFRIVTMEGEAEYEALSGSNTLTAHMVAGAAAGIMEHCVMYPIDSVKVRITSTLHAAQM